MSKLKATPVRKQSARKVHVHDELSSSKYVYIRRDGVKKPLQKPYNGSYKVLKRGDKHFTVEVGGKQDVVSLDRLKPAHLDLPSTLHARTLPAVPNVPSQQPSTPTTEFPDSNPVPTPVTTRSGRQVCWPACFLSSLTLFTGGGVL